LSCLSFKLRRLTTPLVSSESSCVSNLRIVCGNTLPTTTWPQMWRNGNASHKYISSIILKTVSSKIMSFFRIWFKG
jgi:hypothetical protein